MRWSNSWSAARPQTAFLPAGAGSPICLASSLRRGSTGHTAAVGRAPSSVARRGGSNPEVFAIGGENAAWVNHGLGWTELGTNTVLELSAPAEGIGLPGDLVYEVAKGHGGLLHSGTTFTSIGSGSIE